MRTFSRGKVALEIDLKFARRTGEVKAEIIRNSATVRRKPET